MAPAEVAESTVVDIAGGGKARTQRVRLRVEQLTSVHTKGILLLHAFGSLVALAVAIYTVIFLHRKVPVLTTHPNTASGPALPTCMDRVCADR